MSALQGLHVLVTRPAHQADALCRLLETAGAVALRLPLLEIQPPYDPAAAHDRLAHAADFDWLIFTSANAVRGAAPWLTLPPPTPYPRLACIGFATAAALKAAGCDPALVPAEGSTSEDLLATPAMRDVKGRSVLLVRGEGGRETLPATLAARGAQVETAAVYRRVPVHPAADDVAALLRRADAAIVTSGETLTQLVRVTPACARERLLALQLVVPSARVVQTAIELGFGSRPLAPASVSDSDFVDLVVAWARRVR